MTLANSILHRIFPGFPARRRARGWLALFALALFWCQSAQAISTFCEIQLTSPAFPYLYGDPGTTQNFTFTINEGAPGDCGTAATGTITVDASDSTGGATVSAATFSGTGGNSFTIGVNLGPTGGGSGIVHVVCTGGCNNGNTAIDVNYYSNTVYLLEPRGGSFDVVSNQIKPAILGVRFTINGQPAVDETMGFYEGAYSFSSGLGTDVTDSLGRASISHLFTTPGNYNIVAGWLCDGLCRSIDLNLTVEPVLMTAVTPASGSQSTAAGTSLPLTARFGSASFPASAGTAVAWSILSQPAGGDGALTGSKNTDSQGQTSTNFAATVPGDYQVVADSGCSVCTQPSYTFTVTVKAASVGTDTLTAISGDNQVRLTNTVADDPLVVRLLDGNGVAVANSTISWSVVSGDASVTASSNTDASGNASATLSFGSAAGPVVVRASALSGALTVDFSETSANANSVIAVGGDAQTGLPGATLPQPLVIQIVPPSGVTSLGGNAKPQSLSGIPVTWTVTSGGGSVSSSSSLTDASGQASVQYTLGATPGTNTVQASVVGATPATFTVTTAAAVVNGHLNIVSGNNQSLTTGADSAPLKVALTDDLGNAIAGVTVHWTASGATVSAASSITDANGQASITAKVTTIGAASVSASTDTPAAGPVVFALNAGLSGLPGLSQQGSAIAGALDKACPALAALSNRSAGEQDLYEICQDLGQVDPQSAIDAIGEMFPDFSLALADASLQAAQSQFQNLKARIAALRSGTQGSSFGGLAIYSPLGNIPIASLIGAFAGQDADSKEAGAGFDRWGYFVSGTIGRGKADAGSVNPAYDFDINGLTAGIDYRKSDQWIFGGAVGYTKQSTDLRGQEGKLDTKGWSVSGYSTFYKESSWYSDAVLTYGQNSYDTMRHVHFTLVTPSGTSVIDQVARSSSSGSMVEGALTVGRDFQKGGWSIGPYGRMLYTRLNFDAMSEHLDIGAGTGLGLEIESRDISSLSSQIGAKFAFAHSADWGILMPHVQVEWEHEFRDDPQALTARFLNDPTATPIEIHGDRQDSDFFRLGLGLSMVMTHGRSGFLMYERMIARSGYSQDSLALGFRIEF